MKICRRPRNVLRKFETILTSGSLVIAVCSLKPNIDFSNLQARFGLPLRKCTRKYNFQVSELYVFYGMVVGLCGLQNKFSHAPWYIGLRLHDLPNTRTSKQKVKARWRTSRQPSLEQSELFCCFSLLKLVQVFMEYHQFPSLQVLSNHRHTVKGRQGHA